MDCPHSEVYKVTIIKTTEGKLFSSIFLLFKRMEKELREKQGIKSKIKIKSLYWGEKISLITKNEIIAKGEVQHQTKDYCNKPNWKPSKNREINININYYESVKVVIDKSRHNFEVTIKSFEKIRRWNFLSDDWFCGFVSAFVIFIVIITIVASRMSCINCG